MMSKVIASFLFFEAEHPLLINTQRSRLREKRRQERRGRGIISPLKSNFPASRLKRFQFMRNNNHRISSSRRSGEFFPPFRLVFPFLLPQCSISSRKILLSVRTLRYEEYTLIFSFDRSVSLPSFFPSFLATIRKPLCVFISALARYARSGQMSFHERGGLINDRGLIINNSLPSIRPSHVRVLLIFDPNRLRRNIAGKIYGVSVSHDFL